MFTSSVTRRSFALLILACGVLLLPAVVAAQTRDLPLRLRGIQFDPLGEVAQRPASLKSWDWRQAPAPSEPTRYIVQLTQAPTRSERLRLQKALGLKLTDYVPELAYLETLDAASLRRLAEDPLVRAVVPWVPELKIDPGIDRRLRAMAERREEGGVRVVVTPFPEVEPAALATTLREAGLPVLQTAGKLVAVRITDSADVRRLALLPEVRWIETLGTITLNNATTQWIVQSNVTNQRSVWDHGLHGEGQIIGHIDGLLDLSNCFFRDEPDNTVRPDHRKVVGYRDRTHRVSATMPFPVTGSSGSGWDEVESEFGGHAL